MTTQMYNTLFNHPFFATRFNIPEQFGRALSYEAQIHCLLCLIDEMAGAAWVSPDELSNAYDELEALIEKYYKELSGRIDDLDDKVEKYYTELTKAISDLDDKVENYYTTLNNKIDNVDKKLDQHIENFNSYVAATEADLTQIKKDIATNKQNIANNATNIATNTKNIATNTQNIATNKQNIATNATNIAANASNITKLTKSRDDLIGDIYGASVDADGNVTLPSGTKIPVSALNIWAYNSSPSNTDYANAIRSRDLSNYDIKGA